MCRRQAICTYGSKEEKEAGLNSVLVSNECAADERFAAPDSLERLRAERSDKQDRNRPGCITSWHGGSAPEVLKKC